ncbi:hypothetical protein NHX12_021166, partial [Muraenolepis orangiensis]
MWTPTFRTTEPRTPCGHINVQDYRASNTMWTHQRSGLQSLEHHVDTPTFRTTEPRTPCGHTNVQDYRASNTMWTHQ